MVSVFVCSSTGAIALRLRGSDLRASQILQPYFPKTGHILNPSPSSTLVTRNMATCTHGSVIPYIENISSKKILEDGSVLCNSHLKNSLMQLAVRRETGSSSYLQG